MKNKDKLYLLVHDKIYKYQKDKDLIVSHRYTDINFKNKFCSNNNFTDIECFAFNKICGILSILNKKIICASLVD